MTKLTREQRLAARAESKLSVRDRAVARPPMPLSQIAKLAAKHPFWVHVTVGSEFACWPWRARLDRDGYGIVGRLRSHRIAFELHARRDLEPGEVVRHKCDNPICCNPRHLEAGTQGDNVLDMVTKGRSARGAFNGRAVLSNLQVLEIAGAKGSYSEIAERFKVSKWCVSDIKTGRNWGWLTGLNSHGPPDYSHGATLCGTDPR